MAVHEQRLKDMNLKLLVGQQADVVAVIKQKQIKTSSKNTDYLRLVLRDGNEEISAVYFGDIANIADKLIEGDPKIFRVEINIYNNVINFKINSIFNAEGYKSSDFISIIPKYDMYKSTFQKLCNDVKNVNYKTFLTEIFNEYGEDFQKVPAASSMHHIQFGGVLAHSVSLAINATSIASNYQVLYGPELIDKDLLVTACLIHDVMKVKELDSDVLTGEVDYSYESALQTHITELSNLLTVIACKQGLLDTIEYKLLNHCILAHHGKLEFGSPITPAIPEAVILNMVDNLDANMWRMDNELAKLDHGESNTLFNGGTRASYYKA